MYNTLQKNFHLKKLPKKCKTSPFNNNPFIHQALWKQRLYGTLCSKSECLFWLYSDSLLGGLVSGVSREKGEILGERRESRNHRPPQGSSIHDNKKSKNKKPQQRDSNPRREQMLPQATIQAMFRAPVNQTHAHNPNQTIPQRHLNSRNISLLAFNKVLTV